MLFRSGADKAKATAAWALRRLCSPARCNLTLSGPNGDTMLRAGDEIIAVIPQDAEPALRHLVGGVVEG